MAAIKLSDYGFKKGDFLVFMRGQDGNTYLQQVSGHVNEHYGIHKYKRLFVMTHLRSGLLVNAEATRKKLLLEYDKYDKKVMDIPMDKFMKMESDFLLAQVGLL